MGRTTLHDDDRGRVYADGNEFFIEDKVSGGDPVALCLHSDNETVGKLSIRSMRNNAWREIGFIGFGRDERGRNDPAHQDALEIEVWSHIPGRGFEDADYKKVFVIRHDGIVYTNAEQTETVSVSSMNGRFQFYMQDDGNAVIYDTAKGPVGSEKAAIWSSNTDLVP